MNEGPVRIGAKRKFVRTFMSRRSKANTEYIMYKQDEKESLKCTAGSAAFAAGYRIEPAERGTKVTFWIELRAKGCAGLAEPTVRGERRPLRDPSDPNEQEFAA